MIKPKHPWWKITGRDLFLGSLALGILYDQVLVAKEAQAILIGLVVFLFGSIPALRGDKDQDGGYGPFAKLVLAMLGIKLPSNDSGKTKTSTDGDTPSAPATPDSSASGSSASSSPSSRERLDSIDGQ